MPDTPTVRVIRRVVQARVSGPGPRGPQGLIGQGTPGPSAYEVAVQEGFVGTEQEWLASLQGRDGTGVSELSYTLTFTNEIEVIWNHGLGKYPDVTCLEDGTKPVMVNPIYDSDISLRVQFIKPRSGVLIIPN